MKRIKINLKRLGVDLAGFGLIILGLAIGWLPGPGGIPLVIAGLGLLSVNNHWAKRLLAYIKSNGGRIKPLIFSDNPAIKLLHDLLVIFLLALVAYLLIWHWSLTIFGVCISLLILAFIDYLFNRNRLDPWRNKR